MVLCASEPVTGDPRTQRRVAWGRLVTGEDVTAVLSHADQWPLLPHSHAELSSPLPARSAQEWFNALPDDTAKSIVNMRRSMLHVYKVQATPFAKPAPPSTSTQTEQQLQPQQNVAGMMYVPTHGTDGEQSYAHYQAGQHLLGMVGQKQRTRFPPGVMPPPPGSDWPSYPMYPLPPPGHPMDVPPYSGMGLPMPGGGRHTYGRDGRPLFGPDGQPLVAGADSDLVDDGKGPAEPDTSERTWYSPDNLNPFTQFQYKWGRLDYSGQAVPTPEEQARAELAAQQPFAFGGVYPVGYHPAMVGPNGQLLQYPMAPYGVPGMPTGVPGLPPGSPGMPPPGAPPGTHGMPAPGSGGQHPLSQLRNPYMPQAMPQAVQHMPSTTQYYSSTPAQGTTPTGSHTPQYQGAVSYGQQALVGAPPWGAGSAAQRPLFQSPAQAMPYSDMQLASQQQAFPQPTANLISAPQQQALTPGQQLMQQALLNLQTQQQQQQQQQPQQPQPQELRQPQPPQPQSQQPALPALSGASHAVPAGTGVAGTSAASAAASLVSRAVADAAQKGAINASAPVALSPPPTSAPLAALPLGQVSAAAPTAAPALRQALPPTSTYAASSAAAAAASLVSATVATASQKAAAGAVPTSSATGPTTYAAPGVSKPRLPTIGKDSDDDLDAEELPIVSGRPTGLPAVSRQGAATSKPSALPGAK